jgi:hypothetical protein
MVTMKVGRVYIRKTTPSTPTAATPVAAMDRRRAAGRIAQAAAVEGAVRTMALSLTGRLISPANTPSAIDRYQTTS